MQTVLCKTKLKNYNIDLCFPMLISQQQQIIIIKGYTAQMFVQHTEP